MSRLVSHLDAGPIIISREGWHRRRLLTFLSFLFIDCNVDLFCFSIIVHVTILIRFLFVIDMLWRVALSFDLIVSILSSDYFLLHGIFHSLIINFFPFVAVWIFHDLHWLGIVLFGLIDGVFVVLIKIWIMGRFFDVPVRPIIGWFIGPGKRNGTGSSWSLYNFFIGFALEIGVICNVFVNHITIINIWNERQFEYFGKTRFIPNTQI